MIFTCDKCKAQTATPSKYDGDVTEVPCRECGAMLSAEKHGSIVPAAQPRAGWLARLLEKLRGRQGRSGPMTPSAEIHEAARGLGEGLRASGFAVEVSGDACRLKLGWAEIRVMQVVHTNNGGREQASVTYAAQDPRSPLTVFRTTCFGTGATFREACLRAAERWIAVAFPALHSLFAGHARALGVEIIALDADPRAGNVAWRLHCGPIVQVEYGKAPAIPHANTDDFVGALRSEIASLFPRGGIFSVDLYVAKTEDGQVDVDCRLDNETWSAPNEALTEMAGKWQGRDGDPWVIMRRQFIVFEPAT